MRGSIVIASIGILTFILSYIIYKYEKVELLAGIEKSKVRDLHGLAKFAGKIVALMAAGILLLAIAGSITSSVIPGRVFIVYIISLLFFYFFRLGKYL
ncbi:hypothetical protein JHL18_15185 [Clostridium sp. YIM B02505]|uniref:DUF3784 domain-containing protein n=1 Tax=Clostridium yunnanense TaxID=2800325 RepID=A0ABS1ERK9_9CLOT|nr:hypothetical protein [Clostridium yunnanense]MBK1811964.1 hypothetical protein [Clostridium yunnanense]